MLRLEQITGHNIWKILNLSVREDQKNFVAGNDISIIEAYLAQTRNGHAFPFGLYDGEVPVGFLMIGYDVDDDWENPPEIARGSYNIWRLMLDKDQQGKGYGRQAMQLALDFIRTFPCGHAETCWLSYEPENMAAANLYHTFGFQETGELDGDEIIAARKL